MAYRILYLIAESDEYFTQRDFCNDWFFCTANSKFGGTIAENIALSRAMKKLMNGRTSLVIAHRLSTIRDADMILFMENGNITEQGTHRELLENKGAYSALYYSQFA